MPDNYKVLPEAFGMPYAWVYNDKDELIELTDEYGQKKNINTFIKSFKYRYDEENDDECRIKLGVKTNEQLNHPLFNYDKVIKVEWGYILPKGVLVKSVRRTVAIRDIETDYKPDGIEFTLICTDLVSYLKQRKTQTTVVRDNFAEWLQEIIKGDYKACLTIEGQRRMLIEKNSFKNNPETNQIGRLKENPEGFQNEYDWAQSKIKKEYPELPPDFEFRIETIMDNLITFRSPDIQQAGKSKALYQEMLDRSRESIKGAVIIDGRDDLIDIKERNFNQKPYRGYTYNGGNGDLIDFKPSSNVQEVKVDDIQTNDINPENKNLEQDRQVSVSDFGEAPEGMTSLEVSRIISQLKRIFEWNINNPDNQKPVDVLKIRREFTNFNKFSGLANVDGSTRVNLPKKHMAIEVDYDLKQILNLPFAKRIVRESFLENYAEKELQRKFEARAKIIGDPSIISSRVYRFNNLANRDKGDWYCSMVEHEINENQGYICSMDLLRKPKVIGKVIEKKTNIDPTNPDNTPSYYLQENNIKFDDYNDNSITFNDLNASDISNRLNEQYMYESFYNNGDNKLLPKSSTILFKEQPNSDIS